MYIFHHPERIKEKNVYITQDQKQDFQVWLIVISKYASKKETTELDKIDKYNYFGVLEIDQRNITIWETFTLEKLLIFR